MPATNSAAQVPTLAGVVPAPVAANVLGNIFSVPSNAAALNLRLINASGAAVTFVIDDPTSVTPESATAFNPDVTVSVPASSAKLVKISNLGRFKASGGVTVTPSAATSVSIEAYVGA